MSLLQVRAGCSLAEIADSTVRSPPEDRSLRGSPPVLTGASIVLSGRPPRTSGACRSPTKMPPPYRVPAQHSRMLELGIERWVLGPSSTSPCDATTYFDSTLAAHRSSESGLRQRCVT